VPLKLLRAITVLFLLCLGAWRHGLPYDQVIIFAGQSEEITPGVACSQLVGTYSYLQPAISNVKISDTSGTFSTYQACSNSNPLGASSGGSSTNWGPEAQFAYRWSQDNPTRTLYIIKNAVGSTPLYNAGSAADCTYPPLGSTNANWSPESNSTNCYNVTTTLIATASANLVSAGKNPRVVGVMWLQGWTDAGNPTYAPAYQANLADFIAKVRVNWASSNTPIVIERVPNQAGCVQPYVLTVQAAQDANASTSVPVINTDNSTTYPMTGGCEYTNVAVVNLGDAMYTAYLGAH
jgi:hypothetical protein